MSDLREVADKLSTEAAAAVVELLPEYGAREFDLQECIRAALLNKLHAMAEQRRQQQSLQRLRTRSRRGRR